MTRLISRTALAAVLASAATAASAGTLDFTAAPVATSGTVDGVGYAITTTGGAFNTTTYDGGTPLPTNSFDLAFDLDGAGVGDDEISSLMNGSQSIVVTFDRSVMLQGFAFLDLFEDDDHNDDDIDEIGVLTVDGGDVFEIFANQMVGTGAGYAELTELSKIGTEFAFTVRDGNDSVGQPDAALAALQVAAIPVPAAGILLVGALGGLGAMRRRRG